MSEILHVSSAAAVVILLHGAALAEQRTTPQSDPNPPPSAATKYTIPHTGGYGWASGQNSLAPPNSKGGSVGVQYPPNKGPTKVYCNGKPC